MVRLDTDSQGNNQPHGSRNAQTDTCSDSAQEDDRNNLSSNPLEVLLNATQSSRRQVAGDRLPHVAGDSATDVDPPG
jgi:hypothetical protein